jgi:novobiocin biosynthesis protein NovU/D-mycarose 3-C-methyltransferase
VTETLSGHFRNYARLLRDKALPVDHPFVVEIGSNDGVLLKPLKDLGVEVLGVDPAKNVVSIAKAKGVKTICDYFTEPIARQIAIQHGLADVITASNVFAHIDDIHEVMRGVCALLKRPGFFVIEVHYIVDLLEKVQFDTIYHEHLSYFSIHALTNLFGRYGMEIVEVERLPMHGGAVRVFTQRPGVRKEGPSARVYELMRLEQRLGIDDPATYVRFGQEAIAHRDRLRGLVLDRKASGRRLSGYGAAGRGTILLNYCDLDHTILDYIIDASPLRAGKFMPGVHIPIVPPSMLTLDPTDDCLMVAWNYREEIVRKEAAYLSRGGRFIIPLPTIEVVP